MSRCLVTHRTTTTTTTTTTTAAAGHVQGVEREQKKDRKTR
jgi:hypothetical protein